MPADESAEDAQEAIDRKELQARVNRAIALAALALDDDDAYEDTERLEIIQRAHIRTTLFAHEDARSQLMGMDPNHSHAHGGNAKGGVVIGMHTRHSERSSKRSRRLL